MNNLSSLYDAHAHEKEVIDMVRFILVDEGFKSCDAKFEDLEITSSFNLTMKPSYRLDESTHKSMEIDDVITIKHIPSQCYIRCNNRSSELHNSICLILNQLGRLIKEHYDTENEKGDKNDK